MKILVAVLVVLGLAAIPIVRMTGGSSFGVDAEHPLGDFETVEAHLLERDYVKRELEVDLASYGPEVADEVAGAKMWQFELRAPRDRFVANLPRVDVIVDANGAVRGVGAHFFSGSLEMERSTNSVEDLARELGGPTPAATRPSTTRSPTRASTRSRSTARTSPASAA
jgi:hypothetical protein